MCSSDELVIIQGWLRVCCTLYVCNILCTSLQGLDKYLKLKYFSNSFVRHWIDLSALLYQTLCQTCARKLQFGTKHLNCNYVLFHWRVALSLNSGWWWRSGSFSPWRTFMTSCLSWNLFWRNDSFLCSLSFLSRIVFRVLSSEYTVYTILNSNFVYCCWIFYIHCKHEEVEKTQVWLMQELWERGSWLRKTDPSCASPQRNYSFPLCE